MVPIFFKKVLWRKKRKKRKKEEKEQKKKKMKQEIKYFIIFLLLPFLFSFLLNFLIQKEYSIPSSSGIIIISGASTGIGYHLSISLAQKGYYIFAGVRKDKDLENLKNLNLTNLLPIKFDVTDHQQILSSSLTILKFSKDNKKPIIGLINNAGVSRKVLGEFHDLKDARRVFDTNFFGMVDLTQTYLPILRETKGRIVMISSLSGLVGSPISSIYVASKFAMEGFSDSLRREINQFGISLSIIEPGYVKSSIFATSADESVISDDKLEIVNKYYQKFYDEKAAAKRQKTLELADDPIVVTNAVIDALTSKYPKTRYPVANAGGIPAVVVDWARWLFPDRLLDLFL